MESFSQIIEKRLLSEQEGLVLNTCSTCGVTLGALTPYLVAKAYSQGRCILEAVQCFECQYHTSGQVSEQSMENISLYGGRRLKNFMHDRIARKLYHLEDPMCLVTGENLRPRDSFELYSFMFPGMTEEDTNYFFIGPAAMEQMTELMSAETKKAWEEFMEEIQPKTPDAVISPFMIR